MTTLMERLDALPDTRWQPAPVRDAPHTPAMSPATRYFFTELADLFRRHNATLSGCGCCGSPAMTVDGDEEDCVHVDDEGVHAAGQVIR